MPAIKNSFEWDGSAITSTAAAPSRHFRDNDTIARLYNCFATGLSHNQQQVK